MRGRKKGSADGEGEGEKDGVRINREELERIIDERVAARLENEDRSGAKMSRRGLLGLAGGVAGIGALSSSASGQAGNGSGLRQPAEQNSGIATAEEVQAETIHAGSTLTVDGQQITASSQLTTSPPSKGPSDVIYAADASEIQDAIDTLAEDKDGYATGGIVQLDAKTYYPETTIWLKRGVTLQGVRPAVHQHNPYGEKFTSGTVISTRDMPEGKGDVDPSKGANTYSHSNPGGENWHPHLPVIANFRTKPYYLKDRDPTNYEADHWGNNVGLKNVVIDAREKQRWWKGGSSDATYFGVYDAVIFEVARNITMENVTTMGFLGYGGFFNGCRGLVDRGSTWQGGATDYHGAALHTNLGYPPDPTTYTEGVWDVNARGPAPTVLLEGDFTHQFVAGGWSQAKIKADDHVFLGDENDYWAGEVPLTDPNHGNSVFVQELARTRMDGYHIEGGSDFDGIRANDRHFYMSNTNVFAGGTGINHVVRVPFEIRNCRVGGSDVGLSCGPNAPEINGLKISGCWEGIRFSGRANHSGVMDNVRFKNGVSVAFGSGNNKPIYMGTVYFGGAEKAGKTGEYLMIDHPVDPNGIY